MERVTQIDSYQFWTWKHKLGAVLTMLSLVMSRSFSPEELAYVKYELTGSNYDEGKWFDWPIGELSLKMATDKDDPDIIHLSVRGTQQYYERIKLVDAIQATL